MPSVAPVTVPRRVVLDVLKSCSPQFQRLKSPRLVRCRGLKRSGQDTTILCPCDNGHNNCLTSVRLAYRKILLEGWLQAEMYIGMCPYCRRVYWG